MQRVSRYCVLWGITEGIRNQLRNKMSYESKKSCLEGEECKKVCLEGVLKCKTFTKC